MILVCCITAVVFAAMFAAEFIHARRVRQIGHLIFGRANRPTLLAHAAPAIRVISVSGLMWGTATLLMMPTERFDHGSDESPIVDPATLKRVVLLLDVSPSMDIKDADNHQSTRGDRAANVVLDALSRFSFDRSRLSVMVFYTGVRPVVLDTVDPNVVRHIVWNNNFNMGFSDGDTDLISAVGGAFDFMKDWRPASTTLMVLTDGDTVSRSNLPRVPPAIDKVIIVGVGDSSQGTPIAGHLSRQEAGNLQQLAARLNGVYFNADTDLLPTDLIADTTGQIVDSQSPAAPLRLAAMAAIAIGSIGLLSLPIGLIFYGRVAIRSNAMAPVVSAAQTGVEATS